jgi:hypothetical protein
MMPDLKKQHDLSDKYPEKGEVMKEAINTWLKERTNGTRVENNSPPDDDLSMFHAYTSETR